MASYETTRKFYDTLEKGAWIVLGVGSFLAVVGLFNAPAPYGGSPSVGSLILAAMPGALIAVFGVLGVVQVQSGRATVDTAEMTGQILKVSRDQLEISKQMLRDDREGTASFAAQAEKSKSDAAKTTGKASYSKPAKKPAVSKATATGIKQAAISDKTTNILDAFFDNSLVGNIIPLIIA